jgi:hypothetical protein
MSHAGVAWGVLAASVVTYDVLCPQGQTMSEGADRGLAKHPWLTRIAIGLVAIHVANAVPAKGDPIHLLLAPLGRRRCSE